MISQMVVGIAVALVLHEQIKGRAFVRGLVLFPYLVPAIVAVLVWRWIFSDTVGAGELAHGRLPRRSSTSPYRGSTPAG